MIHFTIPGQAVGKGRPRVGKRGGFTALYTPEKTVSYEGLVRLAAHRAMEGAPMLLEAVAVRLDIYVQIPASWSQKKQRLALDGRVYPTTKPDIDNVEKAIFDALNGTAWKDDVQVVDVKKRKRYSDTPRVVVTITPLHVEQVQAELA